MALFDNGKMEEFSLFIRNSNTNLKASETLAANVNTQYLCTILHGEALNKFDTLCAQVRSKAVFYNGESKK